MSAPQGRVLSGSVVLLAGLAFVTLVNLAYNLTVARFLGPVAFGHTTAVYTLLILISAVTLSFQILTAKMVAQQASPDAQGHSYRGFHKRAWAAGLLVSAFLLVFRDSVNDYLNLRDPLLIVLLAIGALFYVPLGARRGFIQGACRFRHLALNLVLEGLVRLCGSYLLIELGYGVRGVIVANSAAVVMAYVSARSKIGGPKTRMPQPPVTFRESLQAAVFFAGQVVINNCDIVVVKHIFPAELAGIYAAVAMVGRVIFAASWAIVSSMFPIAAQTRTLKQEVRGVLRMSLLMVGAIGSLFALALWLAPGTIWTRLFGPQFGSVAGNNFRHLLVLYAISAGVYSLSVVLIAYEMSLKIANTGWLQLVIGGAVVAGIYRFHGSLTQVIWVQITLMAVLLLWVGLLFLIAQFSGGAALEYSPRTESLFLRRQVTEQEVIAEFLKNDLDCPEFEPYRSVVRGLVSAPDLRDIEENQLRRALLDLRHGALWRELPAGTQWFEARIKVSDFQRIRVFPRAHWRKLALGDFRIVPVARRVLDERLNDRAFESFREKIDDLRQQMERDAIGGAVLLIGQHENGPLTILDGNHRLVASLLAFPEATERLHFFCGLSPQMPLCCWYQTNIITLLRYGMNVLRHVAQDPRRDLEQLLQTKNIRRQSLSV